MRVTGTVYVDKYKNRLLLPAVDREIQPIITSERGDRGMQHGDRKYKSGSPEELIIETHKQKRSKG